VGRPSDAIFVITGSRHWCGNPEQIRQLLLAFSERFAGRRLVLFHGACPDPPTYEEGSSVDMLADAIGRELGFKVVPFRADWRRLGRRAGPVRNREMVRFAARELGIGTAFTAECHGFPMPDSTGTPDCLSAARKAGLLTFEHERMGAHHG